MISARLIMVKRIFQCPRLRCVKPNRLTGKRDQWNFRFIIVKLAYCVGRLGTPRNLLPRTSNWSLWMSYALLTPDDPWTGKCTTAGSENKRPQRMNRFSETFRARSVISESAVKRAIKRITLRRESKWTELDYVFQHI